MKAIIIRGVPGVGKTRIAEELGKLLPNSEIVAVDNLKKELRAKTQLSNKEIEHKAYRETINSLKKIIKKKPGYIIIEDLFYSEAFFTMLIDFLNEHQIRDYWFRIKRKLKHLLLVESQRNRPIKNSKEDLDKLKNDIDRLKIEGEFLVFNDDFSETMQEILTTIHNL